MKLAELVGERLVIGIPGTRITPRIVRHFQELHAGGLILYRINFDSPAQLKQLIADLEEALGRKLLVMADHEGGRTAGKIIWAATASALACATRSCCQPLYRSS